MKGVEDMKRIKRLKWTDKLIKSLSPNELSDSNSMMMP